ncbi:MAG: transglutaminase domain-containing protein [Deltaproteobacteria bacterium]|nr:transglutaminase domain-containing protein [Deltaproteobacteria bacterium]
MNAVTPISKDLDAYLTPTEVIDSENPSVLEYALKTAGSEKDDISKACALFAAARDGIVYDPHTPFYLRTHYQASNVLERKSGYCVSKACLLCALGRALGIPSCLGFADIRNHGASREMADSIHFFFSVLPKYQ